MNYDEFMAERIRIVLKRKRAGFVEKKMFGILCFMVNDKICTGVSKNELLVRIDPTRQDELLQTEMCRLLDENMKGFLLVAPEETDMEDDLEKWLDRCLEFNPRAKSSKKKKG